MSSPAMPGQAARQVTEPTPRTYIGWQQEKVALLFGLSGQRAAMIAVAVLAAIIPITTTRLAEGLVTWPVAGVLAAAAFTRIGGRTADEWLAAAVSYELLAFRGQHRFISGPFAPQTSGHPDGRRPADLPGILAPFRMLGVPTGGGGEIGIAHHRPQRTYTAVARLRVPGIGLADSARRPPGA